MRSMEGRGMGRSARLCLGVAGGPRVSPNPPPKPPLGLARLAGVRRGKEVPSELDSASIGDRPREDLILGDNMPGLLGESLLFSGLRIFRLACAAAANGETSLGLGESG